MAFEFFSFGLGQPSKEISAETLGGKGAGLVLMDSQGLPVPPGFIIPTPIWANYEADPKGTMKEIDASLDAHLQLLIKKFGYMPLLSVRSGARVSCPGMMDTILNVGLDDESADFWKHKLGETCYANSYHRLITMYGSVVKGIERERLEQGDLIDALEVYKGKARKGFPAFRAQLLGAIEAVFKSWDNDRAKVYREAHSIPRTWGTAVTVQAMVFGNLNEQSCTGVLFTRHPDSGEPKVTGEFMINAQGEDIVAGIRTPQPLAEMENWNKAVYDSLYSTVLNLESLRKDVQDVEFTVEDGKLYILQTRAAKRSAAAAIRIALDMVAEGLINKSVAAKRVTPKQLDLAQTAHLGAGFDQEPEFKGIPACSGVVSGKPVFSSADAINCKEPCILISKETTPDDLAGMLASVGVITMTGGATSHAAVVARGADKPCITGVGADTKAFAKAEHISMDGSTGHIWLSKIPIVQGEHNGLISRFQHMVVEASLALPVVFDVPKLELEEALLYLGPKLLDPMQAASTVVNASLKVSKILYVDFTTNGTGAEADFFSIVAAYEPAQKTHDILKDLWAGSTEYHNLKAKLVLIGQPSKVFKTLAVANELQSLVLAEGQAVLEPNLLSDKAVKQVLKWKQAEGFELISLGEYSKHGKSLVAPEYALQTFHSQG